METYDLQQHISDIYGRFPACSPRPLIGITANYSDGDACLRDRYYRQVEAAGGTPVVIPPVDNPEVVLNTLEQLDGLVLSGGGDYNPLWAGEQPRPQLHGINAERDLAELLITRLAHNRQLPMLGICRGMQTLAMALDGEVEQDMASASDTPLLKHSQEADRREATHSVALQQDSILRTLYQTDSIYVNSFHHQAVRTPGRRFRVTATAPDGIVEAIESSEQKAILGVQWHPEWLGDDGLPLFRWLVDRAVEYRRAKTLHQRILTIDTHTDTPMLFPKGVHFEQRDPHTLVDLHKMTEGRQDAVFMVAYLPQPKPGEPFFEGTPRNYADKIFNRIETIVNENSTYLALARTPDQLLANKTAGRKSIVLGIENGLALEHDLANLVHFKSRGVAYITLCHNGDNDICDSARGNHTHGGVSPFGEQVIREMNRLGIMVDLSHGGEQSFYDALHISTLPIVCSHSNCRALCDVPRNLTDDQLRALAKKDGVAHTTLYPGFLRTAGEATIHDVVAHLEHAIAVMGIDHVGIGTDFDGDGGVSGMADSSEVINFTIALLRRRYSEEDIRKIWGGNWLRVMQTVINAATW